MLLTQGDSRLLRDIDDDFLEALHVADLIQHRDEEIQALEGSGEVAVRAWTAASGQTVTHFGARDHRGS